MRGDAVGIDRYINPTVLRIASTASNHPIQDILHAIASLFLGLQASSRYTASDSKALELGALL